MEYHICILLLYISSVMLGVAVKVHVYVFNPTIFFEVPVPSQESKMSHMCVLGVSILSL
jgi:hypothetical protein